MPALYPDPGLFPGPDVYPEAPPLPFAVTRINEILAGRRAFPVSQQLFGGGPASQPIELTVGWHDSSVHRETGAFAVVQRGAGLDRLLGEILGVTYKGKEVFVYVLDTADVPYQLSLYRRPWAAIARLSLESVQCQVVTVTP